MSIDQEDRFTFIVAVVAIVAIGTIAVLAAVFDDTPPCIKHADAYGVDMKGRPVYVDVCLERADGGAR